MSGYRDLPSVHEFMSDGRVARLEATYSRSLVLSVVRREFTASRETIAGGASAPSMEALVARISERLEVLTNPGPRSVINATGVVLHTNLGRAPLSRESIDAMARVSAGYIDLEFDLTSGQRGARQSHIEPLLCEVTGAEAGLVVNNNGAAVLMGLAALARGKEVIVSRGQAVEIGGGFRVPDIMRQSGAKLVEVGTTNRTYIADYEGAITERTAALLRVHSSNFRVVGFAEETPLGELTALGRRHAIPVLDDIGSGCLLDTTLFGLEAEPRVQDSVSSGAGLVFFSGDKLLGGPQAGIIVGEKRLVEKAARHPLARAVRIDRARLAGLAATLVHYLRDEAVSKVPVWRMISLSVEDIGRRAESWQDRLGSLASVIDERSAIGGGSLPGGSLPTRVVALKVAETKKDPGATSALAASLRRQNPPVIARVEKGRVLFDLRTVLPEEDEVALNSIEAALRQSRLA